MMSRRASGLASSVQVLQYISSTPATKFAGSRILTAGGLVHNSGGSVFGVGKGGWSARASVVGVRNASSLTLGERKQQQQQEKKQPETGSAGGNVPPPEEKAIKSYWGVSPNKISKGDGSEWKWNCFRPWETYKADLTIDLKKHHVPVTFLDKVAYWMVKALRLPTDKFF